MNENETSLYPVVEPSAFPITNRNQLESTMLRMQEDPPATTAQTMPTDVDVLELDGEFDYEEIADVPNMTLQAEAVEGAKQAQAAVILAGLPDRYETEGVDRTTLDLPANQVALIQAVAAVQPNTIVVLYNGAPVTMPWLGQVAKLMIEYNVGVSTQAVYQIKQLDIDFFGDENG